MLDVLPREVAAETRVYRAYTPELVSPEVQVQVQALASAPAPDAEQDLVVRNGWHRQDWCAEGEFVASGGESDGGFSALLRDGDALQLTGRPTTGAHLVE